MTTLTDLERVERELRTFAPPLLGESWERRELRLADTIAAFVREQRERKLPDTDLGPWRADGKFIYSANFDHDAMLTVSGDFNSESVRDDFAAKIADRLNAPPTDTIAAYIASAKAASQPEAAPAQNSEAVTTGWRPIETAPRCDCCPESEAWVKSCLLGRFDSHGWIAWVGQMDSGMWLEGNSRRSFGDSEMPTHWMPLAAPPKESIDDWPRHIDGLEREPPKENLNG